MHADSMGTRQTKWLAWQHNSIAACTGLVFFVMLGLAAWSGTATAASYPGIIESYEQLQKNLSGVSEDYISADINKQLQSMLASSQGAFEKGDYCSAIGYLEEFKQLLQEIRGRSNSEVVDQLYNEASRLRYDIRVQTGVQCDDNARTGQPAAMDFDARASGNSGLQGIVYFSEPLLQTIEMEGNVYTALHIPGTDSATGNPGYPHIPIYRRLFAVPHGAQVFLRYSVKNGELLNTLLFPSQLLPVDGYPPDPPDPNNIFADMPFELNKEAYQSDSPYPEAPAQLIDLGQVRDLRVFMLEVATGQYNPSAQELQLFDSVEVDAAFEGGDGNFATKASTHGFDPLSETITASLVNGSLVSRYIGEWEIKPIYMGEELLILTHPDFLAAANTLADWKRTKGFVTSVVEVNDGAGPGPDTNTAIDALIEDHYANNRIRPSYVLLMGDTPFIPTFYFTSVAGTPAWALGSSTIGSDWPYSLYPDYEFDYLPDMAVGRISVDTLDEANTVVDKIINYEKNPPDKYSFYYNAALAAQFECCREGAPLPGTAARTFTEVAEFTRAAIAGYGKTGERIYQRTGSQTPAYYFDGTPLPADIGPGSGFAWNGSTANITNAWNDGRFLVIHRDHGWSGGWSHPPYESANVDALTNGSLLPVLFSVNCASGWFDAETAAGGPLGFESLCERALRKADGGAVGVLGDSRNSPSWPNTALLKGFIDAIWPNALPAYGGSTRTRRLGDILNYGKYYMMTQVGVAGSGVAYGDAFDEIMMWHVIGDPTLEMWTHYPYLLTLPREFIIGLLENQLRVVYKCEGACITVFQNSGKASEKTPIARGVIKGGEALMPFLDAAPDPSGIFYLAITDPMAPPIELAGAASGDADGDGIPDSVEGVGDPDEDGIPNMEDTDSDGDGIPDATEGAGDWDGDNTPDYLDIDTDNDGIGDTLEGTGDPDQDGTPNYRDNDSDGDGKWDRGEGVGDIDNDQIMNFLDEDSDGDAIPDEVDETTPGVPLVIWPIAACMLLLVIVSWRKRAH